MLSFTGLLTITKPVRINTEPIKPTAETVSFSHKTPRIDAVNGSINPTVTAVAAPIREIPNVKSA